MLAILFVLVAVAFRFGIAYNPTSHLWAFTPVAAALLFFGSRFSRKYAWAPAAVLALSDVVLTRFVYGYSLTADHLVTWSWYAAIALLGGWLTNSAKPLKLAAAALTSSASFFVVSNFAVWMVWPTYPHTLSGLAACYVAAIPFYTKAPVADILFTFAFFAIGALVDSRKAAEKGVLA